MSTLLLAILGVILLGIFVRLFWLQILAIIQIIQVLFYITALSIISASVWSIGVMNGKEDVWKSFTFFFVLYVVAALVVYGILSDIIDLGIEFIRNIFKIS